MHRCLEIILRYGVILLLVGTPLALPLGLFLTLLILQILPLALSTLSLLSPATADLYRPFLPLWPDLHAPLSLHPYATRTALGLVLAYAGLWVFGLLSPSRLLLLFALAVMTGALFLSTSRGGVLSFLLGLLLFALMLRTRSSQLGRQAMVSVTVAAMVGAVFFWA